jgi:hypothetical protein
VDGHAYFTWPMMDRDESAAARNILARRNTPSGPVGGAASSFEALFRARCSSHGDRSINASWGHTLHVLVPSSNTSNLLLRSR